MDIETDEIVNDAMRYVSGRGNIGKYCPDCGYKVTRLQRIGGTGETWNCDNVGCHNHINLPIQGWREWQETVEVSKVEVNRKMYRIHDPEKLTKKW